jgi:ribosome-binding protein aMBF1 (putative translation factor)
MRDWKQLKTELLQNKAVKKEYDKLTPRYEAISELISARIKKGITQKELAQKIGTKQSAIARFEAGNVNPSLGFLEKMAEVMGYKLTIGLLRDK